MNIYNTLASFATMPSGVYIELKKAEINVVQWNDEKTLSKAQFGWNVTTKKQK